MYPTTSRRNAALWTAAVAVVASLLIVATTAPFAAAAGGTTVSVAPTDDGVVTVGNTTTYEVVVDDADGGVGAAEFRVGVDNVSVAQITDVTVLGSGATDVETADDGSWVDVEYAFRNTSDTGAVTVAEVTVEGVAAGTTGVSLAPSEGNDGVLVFDESGTGYDVTGTTSAELTVESATEPGEGEENSPPTADAGSDLTVEEDSMVALNATGSSDPDANDTLSYQWEQTAGVDVTLSDASSAQPTFTAPNENHDHTLTFEVTVTDDDGVSDTDIVNVTVTDTDGC